MLRKALRSQLEQMMHVGGQTLCKALLFAAADTCPRQLLRTLATTLRALLCDSVFREPARQWIIHAVSSSTFPGVGGSQDLAREG